MGTAFQSIDIPDSVGDVTTTSTDYVNISGFNAAGITISGSGTTWLVELTVSEVEPSHDSMTITFKITADGNNASTGVCKAAVKGDKSSDHHCIVCRGTLAIENDDDSEYTLYPQWQVSGHTGTIKSFSGVPSALMTATLVDDGTSDAKKKR